MKRHIVVFESSHEEENHAGLDFRLERQALPSGAIVLALVLGDGFLVVDGQFHTKREIVRFAESQSGYRSGYLAEDL